MNFIVHIGVWGVLTLVVIVMAIYHHMLVNQEDPTLDILENNTVAAEQSKVFKKANVVELWGKILTVVVVLYGLALAGAYVMQMWNQGLKIQHH